MNVSPFTLLITLTATILSSASLIHAERLIGVDKVEVYTIDHQSGALADTTLLDPHVRAFPITATAQAYNPVDGLFYLTTTDIDRGPLVTFDAGTGLTARIASLHIGSISSIEFGAMADGYPLYMISGGGGDAPGSIYTVDTTTGKPTDTGWATNGVGAHAIAFNSNDGDLYHFYNTSDGGGGTPGLEKINPDTGVVTAVPLTGTIYGACNGVAYLNGTFYVVHKNSSQLYSVTPSGVVSLIGTLPNRVICLAADTSSLYTIGPDSDLKEIDITDATYASSVAVTNGVPSLQFSTEGLVRDPTTGILYLATRRNFPEDILRNALFQLDPLTGKLSNPVNLSVDSLTGFTFLPDGTLYAVSGQSDPPNSNQLAAGTISTINLSDGTVTPVPWPPGVDVTENRINQVIAYNTTNGLFYRSYRDEVGIYLETINLSNGNRTHVNTALLPNLTSRFCEDMVYSPDENLFYLTISGDGVYSMTPSGTLNLVHTEIERIRGVEVVPDLEITGFSLNGTATVHFKSVANREYGLYSTTNLIDWEPVSGFERISATPPANTAGSVPLPSLEKGFFRIGAPTNK